MTWLSLDPTLPHNVINIGQQKEFKSFISITYLIFIFCALLTAASTKQMLKTAIVGVHWKLYFSTVKASLKSGLSAPVSFQQERPIVTAKLSAASYNHCQACWD